MCMCLFIFVSCGMLCDAVLNLTVLQVKFEIIHLNL